MHVRSERGAALRQRTRMGPQTDGSNDEDAFELTDINAASPSNGESAQLLLEGDGETEVARPSPADESFWSIFIQVFVPFLIAGLGMVGAGLVLDLVQHWSVFQDIPEVFVLVPALLGLKGNLEMTLASRLSTQANLGRMDSKNAQWSMAVGNLSLIQCQAVVVGFLASLAAVVFGWIPDGSFDIKHALLLCSGSIVTASFASFILGLIMLAVVILSRKWHVNPDNVATPIAASLGDLTTLSLLAAITNQLYNTHDSQTWITPVIIVFYFCITPLWIWIAKGNKFTKEVLYTGWTPVLSAMVISSIGGLILQATVSTFSGIAVFQPVINGVGGNLVAVQASRISTALHRDAEPGKLPRYERQLCTNPFTTFFGSGIHAKTTRVLMLAVLPGHILFTYLIAYLQAGHTSVTVVFLVVYLLAAVIQVALLLYIAQVMVQWMWLNHIDPDNSAIPYLTALGDLLGTGLLAIAFEFLYLIGDRDSDVGD